MRADTMLKARGRRHRADSACGHVHAPGRTDLGDPVVAEP